MCVDWLYRYKGGDMQSHKGPSMQTSVTYANLEKPEEDLDLDELKAYLDDDGSGPLQRVHPVK